MAEPSPTLSVAELATAIDEHLRAAFPAEVWVRGEIQNLSRAPSGHVYFTLADEDDGHAAQMPVVLRARDKERVNRLLLRAGGRVRMTDGTQVRIRGRLDWYAPRGQLQLRMVSIDPAFTLGQLAAARAELLDRLRAEGLLDRNRQVAMPLAPLRIGIVTSSGSAAEADVLDELARSGYAFDWSVADVRVQGAEAPGSVAGAIRWFSSRRVDVLLVARGGGSATDLAAFDHELVARAISESPFPVVTGVGHEVDRTVADEVAHTAAKTPTAAAQHLVGLVATAHERAEVAFAATVRSAVLRLRHTAEHLDRLAARASNAAAGATRAERVRIDELADRLGRAADGALARSRRQLGDGTRRLALAASRGVDDADRRLGTLSTRVAAVDPERALARGWSITRTADGTVVRSADQLRTGAALVTTVADGTIRSTVDDVDVVDDEPMPDRPQDDR